MEAQGLEKFVGSRTTIRLVNTENFGFRESDEEVCLQHVTTETTLREFESRLNDFSGTPTFLIDPAFYFRAVSQVTDCVQ